MSFLVKWMCNMCVCIFWGGVCKFRFVSIMCPIFMCFLKGRGGSAAPALQSILRTLMLISLVETRESLFLNVQSKEGAVAR